MFVLVIIAIVIIKRIKRRYLRCRRLNTLEREMTCRCSTLHPLHQRPSFLLHNHRCKYTLHHYSHFFILPFGSRKFPEYSRSYEFEHVTSSLRYAKSDCKAENSFCKDCEFEATYFQVRNRRERSISCTLGSTQLS